MALIMAQSYVTLSDFPKANFPYYKAQCVFDQSIYKQSYAGKAQLYSTLLVTRHELAKHRK